MSPPVYGLVEAGGTKFVLGIASGPDEILAQTRIETTAPAPTLQAAVNWLHGQTLRFGSLRALGIASFGPIEVRPTSPSWGALLKTPKPDWSGADIVAPFAKAFDVPVGLDTDVNAAIMAEHRWGAAQHARAAVYITVGTGIGGGAIVGGKIIQGAGHPEMGHMRVALHPIDASFAGACPFHGACVEGLASGSAISARWGASLSDLGEDHPAHDVIAYYVAQMCTTLQCVLEPETILLGGGVMATRGLIERVRAHARTLQNGYLRGDPMEVIQLPALGPNAGLLGALALAQDAFAAAQRSGERSGSV